MSTLSNDSLFAKWLENQLSAEEQQIFEQRCIDDTEFSARVESANRVAFEVEQSEQDAPPVWDKRQTIPFSRKPQTSRWTWMPVASFSMSVFAIFLVFSGFEIRTDNGHMQMGFNMGPSQQEVASLIDEKLVQYQESNQALMAQYIDALQDQTIQSRTELTQFLLTTSREERREDFAELIRFINEQRDDDQRFYARQLDKLEAEMFSASLQE